LAEVGRRQLRLSYAFESTERILRALGLMREAAIAVMEEEEAISRQPSVIG
jgi:hypothetical protein